MILSTETNHTVYFHSSGKCRHYEKNPFIDLINNGFIKIHMTTLSVAFERQPLQRHKEMLICLYITHTDLGSMRGMLQVQKEHVEQECCIMRLNDQILWSQGFPSSHRTSADVVNPRGCKEQGCCLLCGSIKEQDYEVPDGFPTGSWNRDDVNGKTSETQMKSGA